MTNNVPKLRFEEFTDNWDELKLDSLSKKIIAGATPKTSVGEYWIDGTIYWMSSGEIHKKKIYSTDKMITQEGYDHASTTMIPINCVLIALAGQGITRGTVAVNKIELCTNQSIASIITNDKLNYNYLFYYLEKNYEKLRSLSNSDGGKGSLNLSILKSLKIKLPMTIEEQTKISSFITKIDEKVELLTNKKDEIIKFKQYLLQNMFPKKGETVPKLRFNKYHDDWDGYTLSDMGDCYNGLSGMKKEDFGNGNSKYITYKTIFDNVKIDVSSLEYVNLNDKKQNLVKKDDLFFTGSSETPEETGMVSVLENNVSDCYLNSFSFGYRLNDTLKFNSIFLGYYFRNPFMRKILTILSQGSTRFNLSKKEVLKIRITIPSTEEQEKIASFLSSVDKKIDLLDQEIEYS
jgi:type I restriction enzyme S subunit